MRLKRRCNTDCQTQTKACLLRSLYLQKYNVINERDMGYAGAGENICLAGSWMVGGEHGVGTSDRHERASVGCIGRIAGSEKYLWRGGSVGGPRSIATNPTSGLQQGLLDSFLQFNV